MEHDPVRDMERVVRRVMKTVAKYDKIGKAEFESILREVVHEVQKRTGFDRVRVAAATPKVIDDMPREYGQLGNEERSWEAAIGYLYAKHLQVLGVFK